MKRANTAVQTIFFIMMIAIFAWILIFGIQKLFFVEEQLSEAEVLDLKRDLEETFSYCEDPLNRGNFKVVEMKNPTFNGVCLLGDELSFENILLSDILVPTLTPFFETQDNVVLLGVDGARGPSQELVIHGISPVDSFSVYNPRAQSICYFDEDFDGTLEIRVECSQE